MCLILMAQKNTTACYTKQVHLKLLDVGRTCGKAYLRQALLRLHIQVLYRSLPEQQEEGRAPRSARQRSGRLGSALHRRIE